MPEPTHARSRASAKVILAYLTLVLALAMAPAARAGQGVVNANQHKAEENSGCQLPLTTCPENLNLPWQTLGNDSRVAANSFHVLSRCQSAYARCSYDHLSKPKILSSDGCVDPLVVQNMIQDILDEPPTWHPLGTIHFEHFDLCLSRKATEGRFIGGISTIPDDSFCNAEESSQDMLQWIQGSGVASVLGQNGLLLRTGDRLQWKVGAQTANKRLMGYGFMGALAADTRLDSREYLKTLREHNVNLTRVWAIEQWTSLAVDREPGTQIAEGLTPFVGTLEADYQLFSPNPAFYARLRDFAQQAADRGIVVQLSVFDKHGLICDQDPGQYQDSPFRDSNNDQPFLENIILNCSCPAPSCPFDGPARPDAFCSPLDSFVKTLANPHFTEIRAMQIGFLRRVGEEVGGIGNVMYEIINEPRRDRDWQGDEDGDSKSDGTEWQIEMARQMLLSLPLANSTNVYNVSRDAFNADTNGTLLDNKPADLSGLVWTTSNQNAKVVAAEDTPGSSRLLGYVTSRGRAGQSNMNGSLSFSGSTTWTKMQLRADLTATSGQLTIGIANNCGATLYVELDATSSQLTLATGPCTNQPVGPPLGVAELPVLTGTHNVRLRVEKDVNPELWHVSVFLDGEVVTGLEDVITDSLGEISEAYFIGSNGSIPYPPDVGKVDNFEAARF